MISKAQVDFLVKLHRKKYRDQHQKFLVENPKVIWEEYGNPLLDTVYVTDEFYEQHESRMVFKKIERVSIKDFKKISTQVNPAGMVALFNLPDIKKFKFTAKHVLLLDNIRDPGNLGTIIRTADWFGFSNIFLSKNCAEVYNPKVVAASMGSVFSVNIYDDLDLGELIADLKKEKYKIVATDLVGDKVDLKKLNKLALVIGNEAKGVAPAVKEAADYRMKINKAGKAESLNAAVAAGVSMNQIKF